jgi:hypothetical protein
VSTTELLREISEKRQAIPATALKAVLQALMRDGAEAWQQLAMFDRHLSADYPYRWFIRRDPRVAYFERLLAFVEADAIDDLNDLIREAGLKPGQMMNTVTDKSRRKPLRLPSPEMARRLRIVTLEVPRLLVPLSRIGIASTEIDLWRLMWMYANGLKAPAIAENLNNARMRDFRRSISLGNLLPDELGECQPVSKAEINETCEAMKPVKRNQIFRVLDKVYTHLADKIEPLLDTDAVAA